MSAQGVILLICLIVIFLVQSVASGARWRSLGAYHWGGALVALGLLWILASI